MNRPRSSDRRGTVCAGCGVGHLTLYTGTRGAAFGDFRVVCREEGCDYGDRVDAEGNGYTNHAHLALAKAALSAHQQTVTDTSDAYHDAQIEQHPVPAVVDSAG